MLLFFFNGLLWKKLVIDEKSHGRCITFFATAIDLPFRKKFLLAGLLFLQLNSFNFKELIDKR